jgi:hypothetical protein
MNTRFGIKRCTYWDRELLDVGVGGLRDLDGRKSVGEVDGSGEDAVVDLFEGGVLVAHEAREGGLGGLED